MHQHSVGFKICQRGKTIAPVALGNKTRRPNTPTTVVSFHSTLFLFTSWLQLLPPSATASVPAPSNRRRTRKTNISTANVYTKKNSPDADACYMWGVERRVWRSSRSPYSHHQSPKIDVITTPKQSQNCPQRCHRVYIPDSYEALSGKGGQCPSRGGNNAPSCVPPW